ncbi:MAG TPA: oligoribonuclease [Actinobacteria bacterium]|nr:oligoribonuclease [Actinomycetota bacterium]
MSDRLVWIDCEMTGLNLQRDALIEIAVLVTDAELNVLGDGVDLLIAPPPHTLDQMVDVVRQMHTASGLLDELANGMELAEAEERALEYIRTHVPEARKAPLAGSSVHMDRAFLARDMADLEAHVHYRNVDVSTIKELARRWYPKTYFNSPEKRGNHRALADIRDSIRELQYYRSTLFVPPPGPDGPTTKAAARALDTPR